MSRRVDRSLLASLVAVVLAAPVLGQASVLPYLRGTLEVDGRLADWAGQYLEVRLAEPELATPAANRGRVLAAWDKRHLWVAFEVQDAEVVPPPPDAPGFTLYQWDSVEVYVDATGDAGHRMGQGDFQLLVACDGQRTAFRGDDLFEPVEVRVPKIEDRALAFVAAVARQADGYTVELQIPWASLGVAEPRSGLRIGLDVAWNDWLEEHPQLPENVPDIFTKAAELRHEPESRHVSNPAHMSTAEAQHILAASYFPWAWSATRDFGYPAQWHAVELGGGPSLAERLGERYGAAQVALGAAAASGLVGVIALALLRVRHRRRVRALMECIAALQAGQSGTVEPVAAPAEAPSDALAPAGADALERVLAGVTADGAATERDIPARAVAYLCRNLGASVSVEELADAVHVSRRTLHRAIVGALGCTPSELITAVRMREAERLLTVEDRLVKQVADDLGFASIPHFSRTFKRFHGYNPSEASRRSAIRAPTQ